jgi:hypothetical protein
MPATPPHLVDISFPGAFCKETAARMRISQQAGGTLEVPAGSPVTAG